MKWLQRAASSDIVRIKRNIKRLEALRDRVHQLGYFGSASQSGGFEVLSQLLDEKLVRGRPRVYDKLKSALIGENNQKIVLDAPHRFHSLMNEAEDLIKREISNELKKLRELSSE